MVANGFQDMIFSAEPFQESQGTLFSPHAPVPLDALNAFYDKMEKRKSDKKLIRGSSLWNRKNHQGSAGTKPQQEVRTAHVQHVHSPYDALPAPDYSQSRVSLGPGEDSAPSIIPDVSPEGASWQTQELELATLSVIQFRARHPIHNPVGPRWYKNHHILPPQSKGDQRPPSMFSSSFPPMTASSHTQSQDSAWLPAPSRTPSGSPLPTPNSSQTRISDPQAKVRSRKTSQTAHDEVDLMDGTDPWGQQWHHQSPYDVGLTRQGVESRENMVSKPPNQQNSMPHRARRASFTSGIGRHKAVTPSPLSQSTSAVHLQSQHTPTLDPSTIGVPRRLSKRRKPFQGLFGDGTQSQPQSATTPASDNHHTLKKQSSKRSSTSGSGPSFTGYRPLVRSQTTQGPTEKKEKRGSILGRIVRKISMVRKSDSIISTNRTSFQADRRSQSQLAELADKKPARTSTSLPEKNRQSKATITSPTTTEPETSADPPVSRKSVHAAEARSSISVDIEEPMTLGKLTIANPDAPSAANTPAKTEEPLPANDVDTLSQHTLRPTAETSQPPPESPKQLARTPPQRESRIRNSIPQVQPQRDPEPEPEERDDAPPPVPSKSPFFTRLHLASIPAESVFSLPGVIPTIPTEGTPSITNSPLEERFDPHPLPMSPNPPATNLRQHSPSPPTLIPVSTRVPQLAHAQELPDDSPLARASLYVNPGTPYVTSSAVIAHPRTTDMVKAQPAESSSQRQKSSTTSKSRETETFRLVRSSSGPDPEKQKTFLADGAHWEVENTDQRKKDVNVSSRSSKHKASNRETNGEERRHSKRESTRESVDERNQRKETTEERHHRRESRRLEGARERERDREREDRKSRREKSSRDSYSRQEGKEKQKSSQGTSSAPTRTSVSEVYRRSDYTMRKSTASSQQSFPREHDYERRASASSRPTSEVPPTQMLNDLRAKEVWEMDRIWKGRSMSINQEGSNVIASPMSTGADLDRHDDHHHSSTHGSSRTYFVVQAPVHGQNPSGQQNGVAFPSTSPPKANGSSHRTPPPELLRPAQYQFPPLPQSLRALDDSASKDYWAKLAGVSASR